MKDCVGPTSRFVFLNTKDNVTLLPTTSKSILLEAKTHVECLNFLEIDLRCTKKSEIKDEKLITKYMKSISK